MDNNANINWIVAGQPRYRRLNIIKSFYVKFEHKIPALVEDFCRYYAEHRNKTVVYYFDATALGSNLMRHDEKYLLKNQGFAGKQRLVPFFNRSNNEDLFPTIQSAGVSRGRNVFFANKAVNR